MSQRPEALGRQPKPNIQTQVQGSARPDGFARRPGGEASKEKVPRVFIASAKIATLPARLRGAPYATPNDKSPGNHGFWLLGRSRKHPQRHIKTNHAARVEGDSISLAR
jgi:hypothetical protein